MEQGEKFNHQEHLYLLFQRICCRYCHHHQECWIMRSVLDQTTTVPYWTQFDTMTGQISFTCMTHMTVSVLLCWRVIQNTFLLIYFWYSFLKFFLKYKSNACKVKNLKSIQYLKSSYAIKKSNY